MSTCDSWLTLSASSVAGYSERTRVNAQESHLTVYFYDARYHQTSGMRLTQKYSRAFVPLCVNVGQQKQQAQEILRAIKALSSVQNRSSFVLNIAGNGISRFDKKMTQCELNAYVYECLREVEKELQEPWEIRSGGQTGADWAGLVAGCALGKPVLGYFPKGFLQRDEKLKDIEQNVNDLKVRLEEHVRSLNLLGKNSVGSPKM